MQFSPTAGALGAKVTDVNLCAPPSAEDAVTLRQALAEHQVLFFENQPLAPQDHMTLAAVFGPPVQHGAYPTVDGFEALTILEVDETAPPKIDTWHTDMTFLAEPPLGTVLRACIVPPKGGDTLFASCAAAYDALSLGMQRYLSELEASHSFAHGFKESLAEPGGYARLQPVLAANPPTTHPVVRTHPVTGRKCLFVNPLFTTHIVGVSPAESAAVLAFLFDHVVTPEFTTRWSWSPDAVAIWDNRCVYHRPNNDFWPARRRMERVTIAGDVPR